MTRDDYFLEPSPRQRLLRFLLRREADRQGERFGMDRRAFLSSSMGALAAMAVANQASAATSEADAVDRFRSPSEDDYAGVRQSCDRASFTRLDQSTAADWATIEAAARAQHAAVAATVLNMVRNLEGLHAGFGVDQLEHCTQTATRAARGGASDELVLVSLLHDAAKIVTNTNHPELMAAIVRPYVSHGAYRIVRHHMEFQWKHYGQHIFQPTNLRDRYVGEDWYDDAVAFSDVYDQTAFDPAYDTYPLAEFEPLIHDFFGPQPEPANLPAQDCV
jgi:predicted HD phosphohydrolase